MALKHETTLGHAVGHVSDRDASRCGNGGRRTPIIGLIARRVCHCRAAGWRASSHKVSATSGGPMRSLADCDGRAYAIRFAPIP
jgi:hypothetical protein